MSTKYTPDDVSLLTAIRRELLEHPECYMDGAAFLADRYGPARLHREAVAEWERFKDHETQKASNHATATHHTAGIADPAARQARYFELLHQLSGRPDPRRWRPAACASRAIQGHWRDGQDTFNDTRAKAVLILAVLLWDEAADRRHPMLTLFGTWGVTPAGKIKSISRWAATYLLEGSRMRDWMNTVRAAWSGLGEGTLALPAPLVPASSIGRLPIPEECKPVLIEAASLVLAHPQRFDGAAMRLNAELEAKSLPDARIAWYPPAIWLSYIVCDAPHETPPVATVDYKGWAERLVLLATIATYPGDLSRFGPCGVIPWDGERVEGPLSARNPRETVLFERPCRASILFDYDKLSEDAGLVRLLVDRIKSILAHLAGEAHAAPHAGVAQAKLHQESLLTLMLAAENEAHRAERERIEGWLRQDHPDYDERVQRMKADPRWAAVASGWEANPNFDGSQQDVLQGLVELRHAYAVPTEPAINSAERLCWWMQRQRNPRIEVAATESGIGGRYGYLTESNRKARDFALGIRGADPLLQRLPDFQNDPLTEWQSLLDWSVSATSVRAAPGEGGESYSVPEMPTRQSAPMRDTPMATELTSAPGAGGSVHTGAPVTAKPIHSADFTFVTWFGTEHRFALGVQASAVRVLWEEWERTGLGLHQDTIRNGIDCERDNFRMDTTFRNHPAFGTMIERCGDGRYKLSPPTAGGLSSRGKRTKSTKRRNHP